jgi:uncharacterized phage protein (TIGR01671 family)
MATRNRQRLTILIKNTMRKIKFRGLNLKTADWVYGQYWKSKKNEHFIIEDKTDKVIRVHVLGVGQSTGFKDKHGVEIFEKDVLREKVHTDEGWVDGFYPVFFHKELNVFCIDCSFLKDQKSFDMMHELNFSELEISEL